MRINYDFGDLEAFVAVMETGAFHLAATRTNLSQPAITRRVRKLEEALNSQLFERSTRQVRPTLAAKRLYERAQTLLADAEEMRLAMQDESLSYAHQRNAVVTIAAVPTILQRWLFPAMEQFRTAGHRARLRILDHATNEVAEAVAQGNADFGLCAMPTQEPGTAFEPIFDDPLEAFLPKDHAAETKPRLDWADLSDLTLILPAKGTGNRLMIDEAMAAARVPLRWSIEVRRSTTALEMVQGGLGGAILPGSARSLSAAHGLRSYPVAGPAILRPMGILTRPELRNAPIAAALLDAVRNEGRKLQG
ncbi:MAG: LysR family transcriptional regulator [Pseudomonadota bacterium]